MTHTVTPWRLREFTELGYTSRSDDQSNGMFVPIGEMFHKDDAAFVLKAVNSYGDLIEALKAIEAARHSDAEEDWVYATTLSDNALKGLE